MNRNRGSTLLPHEADDSRPENANEPKERHVGRGGDDEYDPIPSNVAGYRD